jgi:hypothetical protein
VIWAKQKLQKKRSVSVVQHQSSLQSLENVAELEIHIKAIPTAGELSATDR